MRPSTELGLQAWEEGIEKPKVKEVLHWEGKGEKGRGGRRGGGQRGEKGEGEKKEEAGRKGGRR